MFEVSLHTRPQYVYVNRTDHYQAYKQRRGIYGTILVFAGSTQAHFDNPPAEPSQYPNLANIFSAYPTMPPEFIDTPIHAYPIVDKKADTLTQSQMLKTNDKANFLSTQPKEIEGLLKMGSLQHQTYFYQTQRCSPIELHLELSSQA